MPPRSEQTAFITGGVSGIGRAVAIALAREGARVAIGDINPDVERAAREIASATSGTVEGVQVDVSDAEQVERAIEQVISRFGALHILGNIAGVYKPVPFLEMTPQQWDQTIDSNLRGVFLCTRFTLPHMVRQGYGRIITMASGLGVSGGRRIAHYAATKAGVMVFTKSVSLEVFQHGITINCVSPGMVDTPLLHGGSSPEEIRAYEARWGRPINTPEDVVGPFRFFLSDAASGISGTTLFLRSP